ncbi:hypothetical protein BH10ACT1_BH10ACT1_24050 [soil metagenome]
MTDGHEFSTDAARAAAERDQLGDWVHRFLCSPGSDNADLADLLADPPRFWLGPVEIPLDQLHRLAGPPGAPVVEEVDDEWWRDDVQDLAERIDEGLEPAPVIVSHRGDHLMVEDGNHRLEALRRADIDRAWSIVGFEDAEARDRFILESEASAQT